MLLIVQLLLSLSLFNCDPLTKDENLNRLSTCGTKITSKVYQGRKAPQTDAPWSVYMQYFNTPTSATTCTGTVISSRHILTATHCFTDLTDNGWIENNKALNQNSCRGQHYYLEDEAILSKIEYHSNENKVARSPERIVLVNACGRKTIPANGNPMLLYEDFAIVELYEELAFSPTLHTACVPNNISVNADGTALDYYGFGINPAESAEETGTLRHESVKVIPAQGRFDESRLFLTRDLDDKTIACSGDSGGGSVANVNGKTTVVGVLSQTSCEQPNRRTGQTAAELYAAVGYYYQMICQTTGVCEPSDYDNTHQGYSRQPRPVRPTPAPVVRYLQNPNQEPAAPEQKTNILGLGKNGGSGHLNWRSGLGIGFAMMTMIAYLAV